MPDTSVPLSCISSFWNYFKFLIINVLFSYILYFLYKILHRIFLYSQIAVVKIAIKCEYALAEDTLDCLHCLLSCKTYLVAI